MNIENRAKGHIVFFMPLKNPENAATEQRAPLAFLSLAIPLLGEGYDVRIIDALVDPNYLQNVLEQCEGAVCLGITAIAGYQVCCGGMLAREVRKKYPELPIVWGGWFSSVKPDFLLENNLADYVVRGQGEITFLEFIHCLENGASAQDLPGLCYRKDGKVITNPIRPLADLDELSPLPYHLVNVEDYILSDPSDRIIAILKAGGRSIPDDFKPRILWHFGSWGCPEQCTFCCSPGVTERQWIVRDPVKFVDEIEVLIRKHRINVLMTEDANFCVSKKWLKRYCEEVIKRKLNIFWAVTGEVKIMRAFDDELFELMNKSGCCCVVIGAESANRETLESLIKKRFRPEDTEKVVAKLTNVGIIPMLTYLVAMPGERPESINDTLNQCMKLSIRHPNIWVYVNTFYPLPGTPLHAEAVKQGYRDPNTLEEWGIDINKREMLKLEGINMKKLHKKIRGFERFHFHGFERRWLEKSPSLGRRLLRKTSYWRIKYGFLRYPVEFWLAHITNKLRS